MGRGGFDAQLRTANGAGDGAAPRHSSSRAQLSSSSVESLLDIAPCTARHAFDLGDLGDLGMRRSVMWGQATDHASMSEYAATYDDAIILTK